METSVVERPVFAPRAASEQRPARTVADPWAAAATIAAGLLGIALLLIGASRDLVAVAVLGALVLAAAAGAAAADGPDVAPEEISTFDSFGAWRETVSLRVRSFHRGGVVLGQPADHPLRTPPSPCPRRNKRRRRRSRPGCRPRH